MSIITIVFAAVLPQFRAIRNSWDSKQANAEVLQNGRVLIDHINRNLSKAVKITAVSDSAEFDGYIQFEDNDSNEWRYEIGADDYIEFGLVGSLSDLAGPVDSLLFTCYDSNDFVNAITDVNSIRLVDVQAVLPTPSALGRSKTFTTSVYLRTNWNSSSSGLVGWWKLDETTGTTAADSSGYGNDGTLINMGSSKWTSGAVGGALDFDGWNDYVDLPIGSVIGSLTNCTITAWVNWDGGGYWQRVWDFGSSESDNMFLTVNNSYTGTPRFAITTTGWWDEDQTTAPDALTSGWHHWAVTIDADNSIHSLYLDGELVDDNTSARYTPSDLGSTTQNWLGRSQYSPDPYFDGTLDDVRIYDRVLNDEEIEQLATILRYEDFEEYKVGSDASSITIPTPDANEGDLLIAAVATDGDTSALITAPLGQGWTLINRGACSGAVTLGTWWKFAGASEPDHAFTWSGSEQAYGWMMRFTGHDSTNPINVYSASGQSSSTPSSPAVIAAVDNCLILRLGAFDDDDVNTVPEPGNPGLSGHTAITMDESSQGTCWQNQDIGSVAAAGSASFAGGTWTIEGSGEDIFQTTDGFHYVYQSLSNDGQITARVVSIENTHFLAKAGVMIRETLNGSSKYAGIFVTPYYGVYFQRRTSTGGTTSFTSGSSSHAPRWFKVTRSGSTFRGYESADGSIWTQVGSSVSISMASDVYIGLAVCSHYDGVLCTAEFDNVTAPCVAAGDTVSGGAGYIMQSSAGDSGTAEFSLGSSNEAQMLTIAIAPDSSSVGSGGGIRP